MYLCVLLVCVQVNKVLISSFSDHVGSRPAGVCGDFSARQSALTCDLCPTTGKKNIQGCLSLRVVKWCLGAVLQSQTRTICIRLPNLHYMLLITSFGQKSLKQSSLTLTTVCVEIIYSIQFLERQWFCSVLYLGSFYRKILLE